MPVFHLNNNNYLLHSAQCSEVNFLWGTICTSVFAVLELVQQWYRTMEIVDKSLNKHYGDILIFLYFYSFIFLCKQLVGLCYKLPCQVMMIMIKKSVAKVDYKE